MSTFGANLVWRQWIPKDFHLGKWALRKELALGKLPHLDKFLLHRFLVNAILGRDHRDAEP